MPVVNVGAWPSFRASFREHTDELCVIFLDISRRNKGKTAKQPNGYDAEET